MLVFLCFIIILSGIVTSKIEIKIKKLEIKYKIKEVKETNFDIVLNINLFSIINIISLEVKKSINNNLIIIKILGIKINITELLLQRMNKIGLNRKILKSTTNMLKDIKKLNIVHSDTKLNIIFGVEDVFFTSIAIPIITNIIISFFIKNKIKEIPKLKVLPAYNQKLSVEIYLSTILKIKSYKIMNIILKHRKNNINITT